MTQEIGKEELEKAETIISKNKKLFGKLYDDVKLLVAMVKDTLKGDFKAKWSMIALAIFAIIYLINPMDAIPDVIPGGLIDDLAVLSMVVANLSSVLTEYKGFKTKEQEV
jgi:uncharacterized membrane protein YkvA (DUF1232 family)